MASRIRREPLDPSRSSARLPARPPAPAPGSRLEQPGEHTIGGQLARRTRLPHRQQHGSDPDHRSRCQLSTQLLGLPAAQRVVGRQPRPGGLGRHRAGPINASRTGSGTVWGQHLTPVGAISTATSLTLRCRQLEQLRRLSRPGEHHPTRDALRRLPALRPAESVEGAGGGADQAVAVRWRRNQPVRCLPGPARGRPGLGER